MASRSGVASHGVGASRSSLNSSMNSAANSNVIVGDATQHERMLMAALNKNQVTYSHFSKTAESIQNGLVKITLDSNQKIITFKGNTNTVTLDLKTMKLKDLVYLNDILIDDILTEFDIADVRAEIKELITKIIKNEAGLTDLQTSLSALSQKTEANADSIMDLESTKADAEHTHTVKEITDFSEYDDSELRAMIEEKAEIEHKHTVSQIEDYKPYDDSELRSKIETIESDYSEFAKKRPSTMDTDKTIFQKMNIKQDYPQIMSLIESDADLTYQHKAILTSNGLNITGFDGTNECTTSYTKEGVVLPDGQKINADTWNQKVSLRALNQIVVDLAYPIGTIYMTRNNKIISPTDIFPNTKWHDLSGVFLLPEREAGLKGGSKKITVENLPPHTHGIKSKYDDLNYNIEQNVIGTSMSIPNDVGGGEGWTSRITKTESTGYGTDYMPPYQTVRAWERYA